MKNAVKMHSMEFCFTRIISLRLTLIFEILKVGVWLIWIFAINFDSFYSVLLNFKIPRFFQEHSMILEKKLKYAEIVDFVLAKAHLNVSSNDSLNVNYCILLLIVIWKKNVIGIQNL